MSRSRAERHATASRRSRRGCRRRAPPVVAAAVAALCAVAAGAPALAAAGGGCAPSARLQGEDALVRPIRSHLAARDIRDEHDPGCTGLVVDVRRANPGYDLFISDAEGRMTRRQVHNADTAALLIESWARSDLARPLLPTSAHPAAGVVPVGFATTISYELAPAVAPAPTAGGEAATALRETAPPAVAGAAVGPSLTMLGLGAETAAERDQALWLGGRLSACVRLGSVCVGPAARWGQQLVAPAGAPASSSARDMEASLAVEAPVRLSRWLALLPRVAAGVGRRDRRWRASSWEAQPQNRRDHDGDRDRDRDDDDDHDGDRRGDPDRRPNTLSLAGTDPMSAQEHSARVEAGVGALVRLPGGLSLELGTFFASALPSPDRRAQLRAGVGLRYGQP